MPNELTRKVVLIGDMRERNTRQDADVLINMRRTASGQKSLLYAGVKIFNELPPEIRNITGLSSFKKAVRNYVIGKRYEGM